MTTNPPHPWMLRLRQAIADGVPLARLKRRYNIDDAYIERLYQTYGWEWDVEAVKTAQSRKRRIRLPGEARRMPSDGAVVAQLSERLREAWRRYGLEGLREGVGRLEEDLDRIAVENIGTNETAHPTRIALSRADLLRLDVLDDRSIRHHQRRPSRSLIVRQALEQVILLRDDRELMKPSDWEPNPLDGAQGGKSAWTLEGKTKVKAFSIPRYLYSRIEHLRTPKGTTAHDPSKPNLSRWLREAIDAVDDPVALKPLVPLVARKLKGYTTSGTIPLVLQPSQIEKVIAIQAATGCNQSEAVAVAVAHQLGWKPDESVWLLWRAVATSGLEAVAAKLGLEFEFLAAQLVTAGYLKPSGDKSGGKVEVSATGVVTVEASVKAVAQEPEAVATDASGTLDGSA